MPATLILPDGEQVPVVDGLILGRDRRAGLVIADTKASRRHARIIAQGGVVELEDMDSSNGTLLNGKSVHKRMLRDGDEIQIGTTKIRYREHVEAVPTDAAGPAAFGGGDDLFGDDPVQTAPPVEVPPVEVPLVEVRQPQEPEPPAVVESEVLEFADDDVVVVKRTVVDLAPKKAKREAAKAKPAERDGGVLQFNKVEDKHGLAVQDLGQMSGVMRGLLTLVVLAVAAGLFYLAMRATGA